MTYGGTKAYRRLLHQRRCWRAPCVLADTPEKCRLNFKRLNRGDSIELDGETFTFEEGGQVGREACFEAQEEFVRRPARGGYVAEVQLAALRGFQNLRLSKNREPESRSGAAPSFAPRSSSMTRRMMT